MQKSRFLSIPTVILEKGDNLGTRIFFIKAEEELKKVPRLPRLQDLPALLFFLALRLEKRGVKHLIKTIFCHFILFLTLKPLFGPTVAVLHSVEGELLT